jgi:tRNA dimethylallyltransferase
VDIALHFNGEVINADSRLFYRGLDIGTAKPSAAERRGVPHHLIDILGPDENFSLSSFLDQARAIIADIAGRDKLPVMVGGTGQYVWGLLEGWDVPRLPPDSEMRTKLERDVEDYGVDAVYKRLEARLTQRLPHQ